MNERMNDEGHPSVVRSFHGAFVGRAFKGALRPVAVAALGISLIACAGNGDAERDAATAAATAAATGKAPADLPPPSDDWKPAIRTASLPENLCDLIPVAEVEAILGKLAEPSAR